MNPHALDTLSLTSDEIRELSETPHALVEAMAEEGLRDRRPSICSGCGSRLGAPAVTGDYNEGYCSIACLNKVYVQ